MPHASKIATCCYCGTCAALVLRGKTRHELSCANCGAPLRNLKMLRSDATAARDPVRHLPSRNRKGEARPKKSPTPRRRRPRKSLSRHFMEEVWDTIEDVFDDIFD